MNWLVWVRIQFTIHSVDHFHTKQHSFSIPTRSQEKCPICFARKVGWEDFCILYLCRFGIFAIFTQHKHWVTATSPTPAPRPPLLEQGVNLLDATLVTLTRLDNDWVWRTPLCGWILDLSIDAATCEATLLWFWRQTTECIKYYTLVPPSSWVTQIFWTSTHHLHTLRHWLRERIENSVWISGLY